MKRIVTLIGLIGLGLVGLLAVAAIGLYVAGGSRLSQTYDVVPAAVVPPDGAEALARGEHLANVMCRDCHGADLRGQVLVDQPPIMTIYASNLTGLGESHSDEALVMAIRHGLHDDGRPLVVMPAESFIYLGEEDLGALIAYLKSVPRSGESMPEAQLHLVGRILAGTGAFDNSIPASYIDHNTPFPEQPPVGPTIAYGEYLARFCRACHGAELAGGQPPDPESPRAPNLTPGGALSGWTEDGFVAAMRTGVTPGGYQMDGRFMIWESLAKLDDVELQALWRYLASLPPQASTLE